MFEIINATSNVYNLTCGHLMRLYIRAILKNLFLRYDIDYLKKNFVLKTYINSECEGYANPRTISDMYRYYGLLWTISINEHGGLVFAKKPVEPTILRILVDLIQHSIVILAQDGWTISGLEYDMDILPPCVVELFKLHKKKLIGDKISMQTVYDCIFTNSPINADLKKVYDGRKIVKNLKKEWETNFSSTKLTPHISKVAELFPDYMPPKEVVVNVSTASTSSNSGTIKVKRLKRVGFGVRFGDNDVKKTSMEQRIDKFTTGLSHLLKDLLEYNNEKLYPNVETVEEDEQFEEDEEEYGGEEDIYDDYFQCPKTPSYLF